VVFEPIRLPHLSTNANAVVLVLAISHSCPDLIPVSIALYSWSLLANVVGR
jgi:hypothetical protein